MKKFFKWAGITIAALIAIFIILIIALPFFLPLDKIKDFATEKISESINRKVQIESVSINILKGIELKGLKIENRRGFNKRPFVSADAIILKYAFWPLFQRKVIIHEIDLVKPEILIEKNWAGVMNFSDMTGQKKTKTKEEEKEPAKGADFDLIVSNFKISNGRLTYIDNSARPTTKSEIKDLNLKISGITLAMIKPVNFKVSAVGSYKGVDVPAGISGSIGLDLKKEKISVPNLALSLAGETIKCGLEVSNYSKAPVLALSLSSKKLSLEPFLAIFAGMAPSEPKKEKKPAVRGELTKTIDNAMRSIPSNINATLTLDLKDLSFQKLKLNHLKASAILKNKQLVLNIENIAAYKGELSGKINVNTAVSGLAYSVSSLKLNGFDAKPFSNSIVETFMTDMPDHQNLIDKISGKLDLSLSLSGRGVEVPDIVKNAKGSGAFSLKNGTIREVEALKSIGKKYGINTLKHTLSVKSLKANFTLADQIVYIKELDYKDTDFTAAFKGGLDFNQMRYSSGNRLTLRLSPATTKDLPRELRLFRDDKGWVEATFELQGDLKKPFPSILLEKPVEAAIGKLKIKVEAKKVEYEEKAKKKVEKKTEEAKEQLKEEAEKQLKELFKF